MLWFKQRKELDNKYKEWQKENKVADTSFNVITYLVMQNLLDEDKVKYLIEEER